MRIVKATLSGLLDSQSAAQVAADYNTAVLKEEAKGFGVGYLNNATGGVIKNQVESLYGAYAALADGDETQIGPILAQLGMQAGKGLVPPGAMQDFAKCSQVAGVGGAAISLVGGPMVGGGTIAAGCGLYAGVRWINSVSGSAAKDEPKIQVNSQDVQTVIEMMLQYLEPKVYASLDPASEFFLNLATNRLASVVSGIASHAGPGDRYSGIPPKLRTELNNRREYLMSLDSDAAKTFEKFNKKYASHFKKLMGLNKTIKKLFGNKNCLLASWETTCEHKGSIKELVEHKMDRALYDSKLETKRKVVKDLGSTLVRLLADQEKEGLSMPLKDWQARHWRWFVLMMERFRLSIRNNATNLQVKYDDDSENAKKSTHALSITDLSKYYSEKQFKHKGVTHILTYKGAPWPLPTPIETAPGKRMQWVWIQAFETKEGRLEDYELRSVTYIKETQLETFSIQNKDGSMTKTVVEKYTPEYYILKSKLEASKAQYSRSKTIPASNPLVKPIAAGVGLGLVAVAAYWWYNVRT